MPPIQIKPLLNYKAHERYGTHFGIFATARIDSHVLIGEYACDIMMKNDLILCKKTDSIMKYTPNSNTYLAPRDFCGFIIFMNSGNT